MFAYSATNDVSDYSRLRISVRHPNEKPPFNPGNNEAVSLGNPVTGTVSTAGKAKGTPEKVLAPGKVLPAENEAAGKAGLKSDGDEPTKAPPPEGTETGIAFENGEGKEAGMLGTEKVLGPVITEGKPIEPPGIAETVGAFTAVIIGVDAELPDD
ncbi:hypothetical protein QYM36_015038 [Artemia franciscana]|uniref:Uncharacterized protein n=1 Tax=Artemia franciscana TaxID=6661 RepID=A0AA88KZ98_ARTSF|nr:hypothetical protein QYM36_015038 [Artemia franciscana]